MTPEQVNVILDRVMELESDRSRYDALFTECGKYSWPSVQDMIKTVDDDATGATVRTVDIYDSTPMMSSRKMAAGIFANLYPVGVRWFELKPSNYELAEDDYVAKWFSSATDIALNEIWRSNFQLKQISKIRSKIVFGTGSISVKLSRDKKLVFESYHIADILFDVDCDGMVDTVFRKLRYTARQARQKFPKANLGETIEKELKENRNQKQKFEILHCVFPRTDYEPSKKLSKKSKKYASIYIARDDKHLIVDENGYNENPYIIGRLEEIPGEVMGIGITANLLPDIKMTSSMCDTFVTGSERQANPTLIAEDDGIVGQPNATPGGMMYIRSGAKPPVPLETGFNPSLNAEIIRQYKSDIKDGFYINTFDVLQDHRNMTAEEVSQRARDSLTLLSPFVGSEQQDCDLIIERVVNLLIESGKIPPLMAGNGKMLDYDIVYNSRLAMAMSAIQANATESFLAKWSPYQQLYPVLDNFDIDVAAKLAANSEGVSSRVVRPKDEVEKIRADRAQKEQMAQGAEIAATAAKAYKDASVPAQQNSLATALAGGL